MDETSAPGARAQDPRHSTVETPREQALRFLQHARDFHLGNLPTEGRHPLTFELAEWARNDLPCALRILKQIDCSAIDRVLRASTGIAELSARMRDTIARGDKVFLYGCGATGRLSLSLEYLWRFVHRESSRRDRVRGFMSGGDLALVHSIEDFEDHPEFGARQLKEIGFAADDLLISCSEGGETPSVIGATEAAAASARTAPWFLYCNPDDILRDQVERSRRVLDDPRIRKFNLDVGPMSLSGSTRLQASTALMLATGAALLGDSPGDFPAVDVGAFLGFLERLDVGFLIPFIEAESAIYARGEFILYETDHYALTILTDTTERAPTFSLLGFENALDPGRRPSLSFLSLGEAEDAASAWRKILLREPHTLEWEGMGPVAGKRRLLGFDFSRKARENRGALLSGTPQHVFRIERRGGDLAMRLGAHEASVDVGSLHPLCEHILLKILLNTHSTLVMGRLGRYESNLMTWVRPSNNKLIDRAIRYVAHLLAREGVDPPFSYEDIALQCFEEMRELKADESVVLKTVASLRRRATDRA